MAASVLHSTFTFSHNQSLPSVSSTSTSNYKNPSPFITIPFNFKKTGALLVCQSATDEINAVTDEVADFIEPLTKPSKRELKLKLLSAVSGLNRGLAASEEDLKKADAAAKELEFVGGEVELTADGIDDLQGTWKLVYSSAFSSKTLGGSRPGPPIGRLLPITLGQVTQRIDIFSKDFDNIVDLQLGTPWPLPPIEVTATLAHKFEIIGKNTIKITFEKTTLKATGSLSQLPPFDLPQLPDALKPPTSNTGSGEFEVTYLDSEVRVTRGDKGELRVFVAS